MWRLMPLLSMVLCALLGCGRHSKSELLGDGDDALWCLDSVSGAVLNEYIQFSRKGTLEKYQIYPDDSLRAFDYFDVVPCLTWELKKNVLSMDCRDYQIDLLDSGKLVLSRNYQSRFYSRSEAIPISKTQFDFRAYREGAFNKAPR